MGSTSTGVMVPNNWHFGKINLDQPLIEQQVLPALAGRAYLVTTLICSSEIGGNWRLAFRTSSAEILAFAGDMQTPLITRVDPPIVWPAGEPIVAVRTGNAGEFIVQVSAGKIGG